MNYLTLKRKTEKNFFYLITEAAAFAGLRVLPGQSYGLETKKIVLPAIILEASDCQPDKELGDDAVGSVTLTASVLTDTRLDADSTIADSMLSKLNELLLDEELAVGMNGMEDLPEPDWHLYELEFSGDDTQYDGDERRDILSFKAVCHELEAA